MLIQYMQKKNSAKRKLQVASQVYLYRLKIEVIWQNVLNQLSTNSSNIESSDLTRTQSRNNIELIQISYIEEIGEKHTVFK